MLIELWALNYTKQTAGFYPSALRAGGVLSSQSGRAGGRTGGRSGGRSVGRLADLRNPYLCNRLMEFLRLKFYGIV